MTMDAISKEAVQQMVDKILENHYVFLEEEDIETGHIHLLLQSKWKCRITRVITQHEIIDAIHPDELFIKVVDNMIEEMKEFELRI